MRYPPSTRVATVEIDAASDPDSGSVVASEVIGGFGPVNGDSHRFFCSSEPNSMIGSEKNPLEHTGWPNLLGREFPTQRDDLTLLVGERPGRDVRGADGHGGLLGADSWYGIG